MSTNKEIEVKLTVPQIAHSWCVSERTVWRWKLEPINNEDYRHLFRLTDILENRSMAGLDYNTERTRKEKELADKLEMQNEEFRKGLISVEDVERIWGDIADNVKAKMLGITNQVSKILAQNCSITIPFEDVKRIENSIDGQIKSALSELSRTRA